MIKTIPYSIMQIIIPVPTYLKKYLCVKYGNIKHVSKRTSLGIYLLDLLETDFNPKEILPTTGDDAYILDLSEFYANTLGVSLNVAKINNISNYLDKIFREHLFEFILIHKERTGRELPAIREFLEYYSITENDFKYETLYRDYKRFKERNPIKKGTRKIKRS
ncbi:hypothetical protein [Myroides odoratimimus]|uniref:hypothetical protein n=1 Tax=Myroides odoratimimus TaxID=76832 RepID=UPI00257622DE|nr:hypothetical protein [Myroides odoratimimus]